jgi:hypothetical protein
MTQADQLLTHLKAGKSITALEAFNLGMGMRLAARIDTLRGKGYDIETEMVSANGKRFARYSMKLASADQYKTQATFLPDNEYNAA